MCDVLNQHSEVCHREPQGTQGLLQGAFPDSPLPPPTTQSPASRVPTPPQQQEITCAVEPTFKPCGDFLKAPGFSVSPPLNSGQRIHEYQPSVHSEPSGWMAAGTTCGGHAWVRTWALLPYSPLWVWANYSVHQFLHRLKGEEKSRDSLRVADLNELMHIKCLGPGTHYKCSDTLYTKWLSSFKNRLHISSDSQFSATSLFWRRSQRLSHRQKSSPYPTSGFHLQPQRSWLGLSFMRPSPPHLGGRFLLSVFLSNLPSCRGQWVLPTADSLLFTSSVPAYLVIVLSSTTNCGNYCHMLVSDGKFNIFFLGDSNRI